jgi:hypothetical protein
MEIGAHDDSDVELVVTNFEDASAADRAYWHAQSPEACLQHALELRRINYGTDRASARIERVLEITRRDRLQPQN